MWGATGGEAKPKLLKHCEAPRVPREIGGKGRLPPLCFEAFRTQPGVEPGRTRGCVLTHSLGDIAQLGERQTEVKTTR